jgi:hypothetical protein
MKTSRFSVGEVDSFIAPRVLRNKRPCLYLHGAGNNAIELFGWPGLDAIPPLLRYIVNHKKCSIAVPTLTETWGNAVTIARMDAAIAWQRANLGATNEPPLLIGASHGVVCALTYASVRNVAAVVGIIPNVDLEYIRSANVFGLRGSVDLAHGVTYPAPLPAGKNPLTTNTHTAYHDTPIQLWYANDDVISTNVVAYAGGHNVDLHDVGALGHSNAAIAAVDLDIMMSFIEEHTKTNPYSIDWHSMYWSEFGNSVPFVNSGLVQQIDDITGHGRHLIQTNPLRRPTFRSSVPQFNGRPIFEFSRADAGANADMMATAAWTPVPQPTEIVMIGRYRTLNDGAKLWDGVPFDGNRQLADAFMGKWRMYAGIIVAGGGTPDTNPHMFRAVYGSPSKFFVDEVEVFSGDVGNMTLNGLTVASADALDPFQAPDLDLVFVGTKASPLTSEESAGLWNWAKTRYGL